MPSHLAGKSCLKFESGQATESVFGFMPNFHVHGLAHVSVIGLRRQSYVLEWMRNWMVNIYQVSVVFHLNHCFKLSHLSHKLSQYLLNHSRL